MSELKGVIKVINDVVNGESKDGKTWKKVTFVIANNEGYEGKEQIFAFDIFGAEKVDKFLEYNKVGKEVEVSFNIQTNEYNGKYYTNLQAWKIFGVSAEGTTSTVTMEETEDLPF